MGSRAVGIVAVALIVLGVACAPEATATPEYQSLASELASERDSRSSVEDDLAQMAQRLETTTAEREEHRARADALEDELSAATVALADAQAVIEDLRLRYDPQIRAELTAAVEAEAERACAAAIADLDAPIATLTRWDQAWEPVIDEVGLQARVEECAAAERSRSAEEREEARLAACPAIDAGQLERNPAAFEGQCLQMWGRIVQFDAATGPCAFQANVAGSRQSRVFDYQLRANFGTEDSELVSSLVTDCPGLDGIDGDDIVHIWATGLGAYSYSTSIGGRNTIPSFRIERVVLLEKR